ncbi:hypothetical protein J7L05_04305 [bacterium]|nr:hypothetical protein [bacterium]
MKNRVTKIITFLIVLGLFAIKNSDSQASQNKYSQIDNHAINAPRSVTRSIDELASYLTAPAKNDTEKVRAIFRWITHNISYDVDALRSQTAKRMSADDVLKHRSSVCQGYSVLFEQLAKSAGLEVETITGFAKGYSYIPGADFDESNHSWNAVKIDGVFCLLDCTWGAGYIGDNGEYVRRFEEHYFLTEPQELIFTHFPENPKWQLVKNPISKSKFLLLAYLKPSFFRYNLKIKSHPECVISTGNNLTVELGAPDDISIIAQLLKNDIELDKALTFSQQRDGIYYIHVLFPKPGKYTLRVFAAKGRQETYDWAIDYIINASSSADDSSHFPETLGDFRYRKAYLYSPMHGILKSGREYHFKIDVPYAEDIVLFEGENYHHLEKESLRGCTFSGYITVGDNDISVGAKFPNDEQYSILLKYKT